jgi:hypothetical protein
LTNEQKSSSLTDKMPPQDIEGQFKFLLCCVKHSSAGKVNFDAVAGELDIVSKAAA